MVIGIFGESCTGKSTLAEKIATIESEANMLRMAESVPANNNR